MTNESEIVAVEGTADQLGSPKFTKDTFVYISNYRPAVPNGRKIIRLLTATKVIIFNIEHTIHNTISAIIALPYWYTEVRLSHDPNFSGEEIRNSGALDSPWITAHIF